MKNLRLSMKLTGGFLIVGLMVLVVGIVGWMGNKSSEKILGKVSYGENIGKEFLQREIDHLNWARKVGQFQRDEKITELGVEKDEHNCAFGKWYYSDDRKKADEEMPEIKELMKQIEIPHTRLHRSAQELEKILKKGKESRREAVALYGGEVSEHLKNVQALFGEIRPKVTSHVAETLRMGVAQTRQTTFISLIGMIVGTVVAVVLGLLLSRSIVKPISEGISFAKKMSEGDLTQTLKIDRQDEVGVLVNSLNQMGSNLRQMFKNISTSVGTLASSATELSAISNQTASGVKEMSEKASTVAAAAEEASSNTTSVAASIEEASTNLASVASATEQMSATVAEIASNSEKGRAISEQATMQAQTISTMMQQLGEAAKEIGKVTETITDISSQTNLLALNATIEAARAGAAGKGFAVVANEIKELARQTAAATEDIKAKIAGVQTSTGGAIADIEKITGVIKEVGSLVSTIAAAIEEQATVTKDVAGNIAQASTGVKDANERVTQTATVSKSIASDVAAVNSAVGEIRQGGEQVQASAGELSKLAEQLRGMVGQFKV